MNDRNFLRLAIKEGSKAKRPYGAVVVKDGEVLAQEHSYVLEKKDPSAHAEITAIKAACKKIKSRHLRGATLYASHEPCLMCVTCAIFAEIEKIIFSVPALESGSTYGFQDLDIYALAEKSLQPIKIEQIKVD